MLHCCIGAHARVYVHFWWWLWHALIKLQSLVNQYFSQTFERLFSKKKPERKNPWGWGVVKCWEFERKNPLKWVVSISRNHWVYLDITWKSSKIWEFWGKVPRIEIFCQSKFSPATWICGNPASFHIFYSSFATSQMFLRFRPCRPVSTGLSAPQCMSTAIPQRYLQRQVFPPYT